MVTMVQPIVPAADAPTKTGNSASLVGEFEYFFLPGSRSNGEPEADFLMLWNGEDIPEWPFLREKALSTVFTFTKKHALSGL
jgi:hypothetical protein